MPYIWGADGRLVKRETLRVPARMRGAPRRAGLIAQSHAPPSLEASGAPPLEISASARSIRVVRAAVTRGGQHERHTAPLGTRDEGDGAVETHQIEVPPREGLSTLQFHAMKALSTASPTIGAVGVGEAVLEALAGDLVRLGGERRVVAARHAARALGFVEPSAVAAAQARVRVGRHAQPVERPRAFP